MSDNATHDVTRRPEARTWTEYHREVGTIAAMMIGAADYFDDHPDYATDAKLAQVFREYVERFRAVEVPR